MFVIPSSSISALTGRNKYQAWKEALADICLRYNRDLLPDKKLVVASKQVDSMVENIVKDKGMVLPINDKEKEDSITSSIIYMLGGSAQPERVDGVVRGLINRNRGTILEDDTIRTVEDMGTTVLRPKKCYYKSCGPFKLIGRYDGIVVRGDTYGVLEVKNRRTNLFIPGYDLDQLSAYMYISDADFGILAQQLDGEVDITEYPKEFLIKRWESIQKELEWVSEYIDTLKTDKDELDMFVDQYYADV